MMLRNQQAVVRCFAWARVCIPGAMLLLAGCAGVSSGDTTQAKKMETVPLTTSSQSASQDTQGSPTSVLAAALQQPSAFVGKSLVVNGTFRGWQGGCKGSPPVSRQDWMLEQGGLCVYVHGPLPAGVQVMAPKGEPVVITGVLQLTEQGVPYLDVTH